MGNEESIIQAEGSALEYDPTRNYSKRTKRLHHRSDFISAIRDFQSRPPHLPPQLVQYVNGNGLATSSTPIYPKSSEHEYAAHPDPAVSVEDRFLGLPSKRALMTKFQRLCETDVENAKEILETLISVLDEFTRDAARKALQEAQNLKEPEDHIEEAMRKETEINIFLRTRPMFAKEKEADFRVVDASQALVKNGIVVYDCRMHADLQRMKMIPHVFLFHKVFDETCSNAVVFKHTTLPLVESFIAGGQGTLFMFGQTGSGKTYTMTALFSHALATIFENISGQSICISVYEILGKNIINLVSTTPHGTSPNRERSPKRPSVLSPPNRARKSLEKKDSEPKWYTGGSPVKLDKTGCEQDDSFSSSDNSCPPFASAEQDATEDGDDESKSEKENDDTFLRYYEDDQGMMHIKDLPTVEVHTAEEALGILEAAQRKRATAATGVHDQSSRSHAFLRISIKGSEAQLLLIDLAGSERSKDSLYHSTERLKETSEINKSLAGLKACIQARSKGSQYVPYRQNLLTRLLKPSLVDPKAVVNVIATASPSSSDTEHTLSTVSSVTEMLSSSNTVDGVNCVTSPAPTQMQGKRFKLSTIEVPTLRQRRAQEDYIKATTANPKKWTKEQVCKWWKQEAPGVEAPGITGALLVRWPKARFIQHVKSNRSNSSSASKRNRTPSPAKSRTEGVSASSKPAVSPEPIHSPDRVGTELYYLLRKELAKVGSTARKKALATRGGSP